MLRFPQYLRLGSRGPAVTALQHLLIRHRCNHARIIADGEFGRETQNGVKALQVELNLRVTGVFDRDAHQALIRNGEQIEIIGPTEALHERSSTSA